MFSTSASVEGCTTGNVPGEGSIPDPPAVFHTQYQDQVQSKQVLNWRRLRCDRCGGPLFLDESDVVTRRYEEYNWLDERPRRGRPPKRLIEERRRERELLESQAA